VNVQLWHVLLLIAVANCRAAAAAAAVGRTVWLVPRMLILHLGWQVGKRACCNKRWCLCVLQLTAFR
jgi:hypothetical protein